MNDKRNYSLAMIALVLRVYNLKDRGDRMMRCSADPLFTDLVLRGDQVAELISASGLQCMSITVAAGDLPKSLQDFANDRHLVMVGMRPNTLLPYQHWAVLETSGADGISLCVFGESDDPVHTGQTISEVTTGQYVVIANQVDKLDIGAIRGAMDG